METEFTEGMGSMVLAQDYLISPSGKTADIVFVYGSPAMLKHMMPAEIYTVEWSGVEFEVMCIKVKQKSDEESVLAAVIPKKTFEILKGMGIPLVPSEVVKAAAEAQQAVYKATSENT
jgi:hypothetical protein